MYHNYNKHKTNQPTNDEHNKIIISSNNKIKQQLSKLVKINTNSQISKISITATIKIIKQTKTKL